MDNNALILLGALIFFSKLLTDLFYRINLPPVLGMIMIGLLLGPTGFNLIHDHSDFEKLKFFAEIGVIILLFMAGLETDIEQMKRIGKNAFLIALAGVFFPLIGGYLLAYFFFHNHSLALLLGIVLTATSVSVTVMTLMDMKKLNTVEGTTVLGAAIIDDVIGILILTFVLGFMGQGGKSIYWSFASIFLYILFASLFGIFIIPYLLNIVSKLKAEKPVLSTALALLCLFAWSAHKVEIAAITGAYLVGLFIGQTHFKKRIEDGIHTIGHTVFISLFFVFIGLETNLREGQIQIWFVLLFILVAILSKLLGSSIVARLVGFEWNRSFRIGSGMIPRGEVALVIATIGISAEKGSIFSQEHFTAIVLMVITSAFITPFLLRFFFTEKK